MLVAINVRQMTMIQLVYECLMKVILRDHPVVAPNKFIFFNSLTANKTRWNIMFPQGLAKASHFPSFLMSIPKLKAANNEYVHNKICEM